MKLPIVLQKDVTIQMYDALPLCIIQAYSDISPWFLSHYLNICSTTFRQEDAVVRITLNYLEGGSYFDRHKTREVLEYNSIRIEPLLHGVDAVPFFKENLEAGFYIIAFFNEFLLSNKVAYQQKEFIRESLIYGYDDTEGCFYAVSFNQNRMFTGFVIPYAQAEASIQSIRERPANAIAWDYFHVVKPLKIRDAFNFACFKREIKNYLNSTIDTIDKYHFYLYDGVERGEKGCMDYSFKYGINVHAELISVYNSITNLWLVSHDNYMNFQFLAEHKRHIQRSLKCIYTAMPVNPLLGTMLESYGQIVNGYELLRLRRFKIYTRWVKYRDTPLPSFEETSAKLRELKEREYEVLSGIIDLIDSGWQDNTV
ncbi:MAG: hypothetical protein LBP20_05880 [Treponema sp.]|jgi:hypothetical protein|nr:hypothetical protein [Treponema sp.]